MEPLWFVAGVLLGGIVGGMYGFFVSLSGRSRDRSPGDEHFELERQEWAERVERAQAMAERYRQRARKPQEPREDDGEASTPPQKSKDALRRLARERGYLVSTYAGPGSREPREPSGG